MDSAQPFLVILVNGESMRIAAGTSVQDIVDDVSSSQRGIAIALNGEVVPRSLWWSTTVSNGAIIEVVTAAAGG